MTLQVMKVGDYALERPAAPLNEASVLVAWGSGRGARIQCFQCTVILWECMRRGTAGGDLRGVKDEIVGVIDVISNDWAFAALRNDGTVTAWGDAGSMLA